MIKITGDTHGTNSINKLKASNTRDHHGTYPDYVIIAGDFGIIWNGIPDKEETYWIDWLDKKPFETLAVLGNHENYERIYQLPQEERFGAPVFRLSKKVFILQHGHMYTIDGKRIFVFGGAQSTDKEWRVNRVSWWEEEVPTYADFMRGQQTCNDNGYSFDYVITHTAPTAVIQELRDRDRLPPNNYYEQRGADPTAKMLDEFASKIHCRAWFFGHFHINDVINMNGIEYRPLYHKFFDID